MPESALQSLRILRDPSFFQWHYAVLLAFVAYVYANEIERRNWDVILGALAFYGLEWFLEIMNGFVLHFTGYSAVWTTTDRTIYQLLPGLTLEISMMFAVVAVIFLKLLPKDKNMKILGINNRVFFWIANSILMVIMECIVHAWGYLIWNYSWWNFPNVWLIILVGYMPYFMLSFYVHDHPSMKVKISIVSSLFTVDLVLFLVFAIGLRWM
ncbi:MAG: hypothetical protein J7J85_02540 [Deltaproteobacteria bacterium]|nr:hypothetical protein [Deltaproteobacteria bacterium]